MPLPWPEIRDKAIAFAREWQDAESERAESQTFWNEFFAVFGVPRRRVASFEEPVKKLGAKRGRIDAFWKGQLVVEHKSRGQDLNRAFVQALDYFPGIADREQSRLFRGGCCAVSFRRSQFHDAYGLGAVHVRSP